MYTRTEPEAIVNQFQLGMIQILKDKENVGPNRPLQKSPKKTTNGNYNY